VIEKKLDLGLHAKRIYQDLVEENDFRGSYWSVMRFVRRLGQTRELPFRRMECEPGEEAQGDFGYGWTMVNLLECLSLADAAKVTRHRSPDTLQAYYNTRSAEEIATRLSGALGGARPDSTAPTSGGEL